jgi:mannosyltransferase
MSETRLGAREWLALGGLTLLGAILRSVAIGREALWADEALTYVLAQAPAWALGSAPIDPTAPLYYWLHQLFVPAGASAAAGRSLSWLAGVATIPAAYWLGRSIVGRGGGLFVAAWVAVSAPLVDYSQEARAYALLVLLITLSALALHRAVKDGRRGALFGFVASAIAAQYTHFVALFWIGPALAILLIARHRGGDRGQWREAVVASAVIIIALVPEMLRVWRYATQNNAFHWLTQLDLKGFADLLAGQWLSGITVALLLVMVGARWRDLSRWARQDRAGAAIVAVLVAQPMMLWGFGRLTLPVLMARSMLPSLVGVGLLIALLVMSLPARARLAVGGIAVALTLLATVAGGLVRSKEQWAATRAVLATADRKQDLILACPMWKVPALMAATRGIDGAPMATPNSGRVQLIERHVGAEARWDRLYYRRAYTGFIAPALRVAAPVSESVTVPVRTLFVVTSECGPAERKAIGDWAGAHRVERRWTSPARGDRAGIMVERWRLAVPRAVEVHVVR